MICSDAAKRELPERYLSRRLPADEMEEFESHFFECSRCSQELAHLEVVSAALCARPVPMIQPRRFRLLTWRSAWVAATALACVAFAVIISTRTLLREPQLAAISTQVHPPAPPQFIAENLAATQARLSDRPQNGRNFADFGRLGPLPRKQDPVETIGPAPDAEMPALPNGPIEAPPEKILATKKKTPRPEVAKVPSMSANEVEIFRLSQVEPPPYIFAGFHPTKPPKNQSAPSGQSISVGGSSYTSGPRPIFRTAMAEYSDRNFAHALALLEEDVKNEPDAVDAQYYLGICHLAQGEPELAIPAFEAALKTPSPLAEQVHFFLAKALLQQQRISDAEKQLEKAKELNGRLHAESDRILKALQAVQTRQAAP